MLNTHTHLKAWLQKFCFSFLWIYGRFCSFLQNKRKHKQMNESNLIYHAHQSFNDCAESIDDSFNVNFLRALNDLTNNVFYIFDYTKNKLIYPDNLIQFLGHKFSLTNQGYLFYENCIHPEDLEMLVKINNKAFDFFYTLKQEEKKHVTIIYDIRLKEISGKYVLVNHHLTPLNLTDDGKIAQALCLICPSCYQHPGNTYIRLILSKKILEYDPRLNRFVENKYQNLTTQQSSILELFAKGYTETQVAELSNISVNTVKSHKRDLFKKLRIMSITGILQWLNSHKKM